MFNLPFKTIGPFIAGIFCCAFSFANSLDTIGNAQLAITKRSLAKEVIIKQANVIYPALLEGHQDYFISYVEKFSVNRRAYLQRTYARSKKYFPKTHVILKKYKVPTEFSVLLALESAFNGNAVSSAGAVGYWQIMDDVAKEYGLKIIENQTKANVVAKNTNSIKKTNSHPNGKKKTIQVDDRKNFIKSTNTAARYLKDRMRNLNDDWLLVAASYNWGVGNVWKAMERTGKTNPTFWDIKNYLPAETKSYVMNFIALNVIFINYENFKINNLCFKDEVDKKQLVADVNID